MNAPLFGSSRPNISVRVLPKIPATMIGAGGIGISKVNGTWTIEPSWSDLQLIAPGVLLDPTTKEIWVHDPVTDIYNRMTLGGLGQALFWGTSTTTNTITASAFPGTPRTFQTQSGKDWAVGSFVQALSQAAPSTDYMIGQVASYVGTTLTVNMLTAGTGVGNSHSDWLIVPSTLPGAGTPGATGASSGLNYNYVFTDTNMGISPGAGNIKFNSTTIALINQVSVHHSDRNALNLSAEVTTWGASTTPNNNARLRIYSPTDATKFIIATVQGDEVNVIPGSTGYSTFTLSNPTGPGCGVGMAVQVEILRTGDKGTDGTNGTNGAAGSPGADGTGTGYRYQWSTSTAGDPGSGKVAVNNAAIGSATGVQISETTRIPQNIAAYLNTVWTSSNSNRGTIYIVSVGTPTTFALYTITGGADVGTYDTLTVTTAASSGSFAANEEVQVFFSRAGDAGSGSVSGANNQVGVFTGSTTLGGLTLGTNQVVLGTAGAPSATGSPTLSNSISSLGADANFSLLNQRAFMDVANAGANNASVRIGAVNGGSGFTTNLHLYSNQVEVVGWDTSSNAIWPNGSYQQMVHIAAPGTPAATNYRFWFDSTDARLHDKNPAGTIGTTVVADTGTSNNFLTAISASGVISKSQPAFTNLSGSLGSAQFPAIGTWKIFYSDGTSGGTINSLSLGAAGTVLMGNGTGAAPTFTAFATAAQYIANTTTNLPLSNDQVWASVAAAKQGALSGSATPDFGANIDFIFSMGASNTLNNPSNIKVGQKGVIWIVQDSTGGRTMSWGTQYKFPGGVKTISAATNAIDVLSYVVKSSTEVHCFLSLAMS